jgi:ribosomal protein S21
LKKRPFFERTSKRRKGYLSETQVKRGVRIVHGDKWLLEKLGRNDPCPCGSGLRFKRCCLKEGRLRWVGQRFLFPRMISEGKGTSWWRQAW